MAELAERCPGPIVTASQNQLFRLAEALQRPVHVLLYDLPYGESDLVERISELAEADRQAIEQIVDTMARGAAEDRDKTP